MEQKKGKIGVLIEEHFDPTEYREFNAYFPSRGYEVEYISHLWGNKSLRFGSNSENDQVEEHVVVTTEVSQISLSSYKGIIAIGAYAMDRLRYQAHPKQGEKNTAPAVVMLRQAIKMPHLILGTICHGLWLFCADADLLRGKKVTCAHNIICDVENAGAKIVFEGDATAELVIDGNLVSCKHPGSIGKFMQAFIEAIESQNNQKKNTY